MTPVPESLVPRKMIGRGAEVLYWAVGGVSQETAMKRSEEVLTAAGVGEMLALLKDAAWRTNSDGWQVRYDALLADLGIEP